MELLIALLLIPALVQVLWLGLILLSSSLRRQKTGQSKENSFAIVIPAHNESSSISNCVRGLEALDYPKDKYKAYVIADNCSDNTAQEAEQAGASVIERFSDRKSKGFALEDCIPQILKESAADAIIVMDADSFLAPDALQYFSGNLQAGEHRIQGYYAGSNPGSNWRTKLMEWAFSLFNGVYLAGITGIGLSSHLRGNGMCFSKEALQEVPWQASGLAEDLEYSWKLRQAGKHVSFNPKAVVKGEFVSSQGAAKSQRSRWEEGRQEVHRNAFQLLKKEPKIAKKLLYLFDLSLWPLGRLVAYSAVMLGLAALSASPSLLAVSVISFAMMVAYILSPYIKGLLPISYLLAVVWAPYYIFWKIYIKVLGKPADWVRTTREAEGDSSSSDASTFSLGGVNFDSMNLASAAQRVVDLAHEDKVSLCVTPNSDHLVRLQKDQNFMNIVQQASLVLPDGSPIGWASKLMGGPLTERVTGADLLPASIRVAAANNTGVALIGGNEGEAAAAAAAFKSELPNLKISNYCPPLGFEKSEEQFQKILEVIASVDAKLVFVGVGSPKQENWINSNSDRLPSGAYLGVGMAIGFASGSQKRAPIWIQKIGMEWAYRMMQEPKRLTMRYIKCFQVFALILTKMKGQ